LAIDVNRLIRVDNMCKQTKIHVIILNQIFASFTLFTLINLTQEYMRKKIEK